MIEFKGSHFEQDVILWGVRWYVAYPISYRQLEEMMEERGVGVDHSPLNRWVVKYVPLLDQQFRARKRPVGSSWRLDETYVKVKGSWKYLYRAVDKAGDTVDFMLTAKRDRKAALRFLRKAIGHHGVPEKITSDKSGANTAAIASYNSEHEASLELRQVKSEQHRRAGPSCRQASGAANAGIQIVSVGCSDHCRHRTHAAKSAATREVTPASAPYMKAPMKTPEAPAKQHAEQARRKGFYTVVAGDTLRGIAKKAYHDAGRWRDIAAANPHLDPRRLRPGETIKLSHPGEVAMPR